MISSSILQALQQQHEFTALRFPSSLQAVQSSTASTATPAPQAETSVPPGLEDRFISSGVEVGSEVDANRLKNLKFRLDGISTARLTDAGSRFQQNAFGRVVSGEGDNQRLDGLGRFASTSSRNPIPDQMSGLRLSGTSLASDDPPAGNSGTDAGSGEANKSGWEKFKEGAKEFASAATGVILGEVGGAAWNILNANGTADGKRDEANGIFGIFRQGRTGTSNENESSQMKSVDKGDPLPSDVSNDTDTRHITLGLLDPVRAGQGSKTDPVDPDMANSSGSGKLNTGASGTGKLGSQAQPVQDSDAVQRHIATRADAAALAVRIEQNINIIH